MDGGPWNLLESETKYCGPWLRLASAPWNFIKKEESTPYRKGNETIDVERWGLIVGALLHIAADRSAHGTKVRCFWPAIVDCFASYHRASCECRFFSPSWGFLCPAPRYLWAPEIISLHVNWKRKKNRKKKKWEKNNRVPPLSSHSWTPARAIAVAEGFDTYRHTRLYAIDQQTLFPLGPYCNKQHIIYGSRRPWRVHIYCIYGGPKREREGLSSHKDVQINVLISSSSSLRIKYSM